MKKQKGLCNWCKLRFNHDDILEIDHIIPLKPSGKDEWKNIQLLHRHCHDDKTALDKNKIKLSH